ncbi:MAG: hypothetical protein ACKPKO_08550, partial [Candidatus Fonsibacter sp.]
QNELTVYLHMTLKAKHSRKYPDISIGDKVFIYMKRKANQKAHVPLWSDNSYEVERYNKCSWYIIFIKLQPETDTFLRHELLKNSLKD